MHQRAMNTYKQNSIVTATPAELTMMLYNGAIKFINLGKIAIEEKDIPKRNESLIRAQDIISELKFSLDDSYEISSDMEALYDFSLDKLIDANINNDMESLDEALDIIYDMRDTWAEVVKLSKKA